MAMLLINLCNFRFTSVLPGNILEQLPQFVTNSKLHFNVQITSLMSNFHCTALLVMYQCKVLKIKIIRGLLHKLDLGLLQIHP